MPIFLTVSLFCATRGYPVHRSTHLLVQANSGRVNLVVADVPTSGGDGPSITNRLDSQSNPNIALSCEPLDRHEGQAETQKNKREEGKDLLSFEGLYTRTWIGLLHEKFGI